MYLFVLFIAGSFRVQPPGPSCPPLAHPFMQQFPLAWAGHTKFMYHSTERAHHSWNMKSLLCLFSKTLWFSLRTLKFQNSRSMVGGTPSFVATATRDCGAITGGLHDLKACFLPPCTCIGFKRATPLSMSCPKTEAFSDGFYWRPPEFVKSP